MLFGLAAALAGCARPVADVAPAADEGRLVDWHVGCNRVTTSWNLVATLRFSNLTIAWSDVGPTVNRSGNMTVPGTIGRAWGGRPGGYPHGPLAVVWNGHPVALDAAIVSSDINTTVAELEYRLVWSGEVNYAGAPTPPPLVRDAFLNYVEDVERSMTPAWGEPDASLETLPGSYVVC